MLSLFLLLDGAIVRETLIIEQWIADFLRPTQDASGTRQAARKVPFEIPESQRSVKFMINGSYPAPTLRAFENDTLEITVVNRLRSEATTIHWCTASLHASSASVRQPTGVAESRIAGTGSTPSSSPTWTERGA